MDEGLGKHFVGLAGIGCRGFWAPHGGFALGAGVGPGDPGDRGTPGNLSGQSREIRSGIEMWDPKHWWEAVGDGEDQLENFDASAWKQKNEFKSEKANQIIEVAKKQRMTTDIKKAVF